MEPGELEAVDVLLVDDDVEWLAVTGRSLEAADDALGVLTAASGREALDLLDRQSFDCVVCDYRMPEVDGLELLERVRDRAGDLPFILVTGSGSEAVASSAISSAVTEYFVKDPGRDQTDALAARVLSAVAAHRTSEALATARRRFTGLFENVPSPVAVVDGAGDVSRVNDAFERTFGVREADVAGASLEEVVPGASDPSDGETTVATRALPTADGEREFLVRRFPLGEDRPETGYVFTDITDQRERQRDLERALSLDAAVRNLLVSASSRETLEQSFCERVARDDDVVLAVVAERGPDGRLGVRARAGARDDVADALPAAGDGSHDDSGDPLAAALRDHEPRHSPAVSGDSDGDSQATESGGPVDTADEWRRAASRAGVGSAFAVPVERRGVVEGAFGVYADAPSAFDDERRERVADLVDSLGDAVDIIERMGALSADRVSRVHLSATGDGPLVDGAAAADALAVRTVQRAGSGTRLYVDVHGGDGDAVVDRLTAREQVASALTVVEDDDAPRVRVRTAGGTFPDTVVDRDGTVDSLRVSDGAYEATVDVPPSTDVRSVVDALGERFEKVTVHAIRSRDRTDAGGNVGRGPVPVDGDVLAELTTKQRDALETAYLEGYFRQPRDRSSVEVGESLGVSGATFLQHLRAAQRKLLGSVFDDASPGT